jgi:signal peptidase I
VEGDLSRFRLREWILQIALALIIFFGFLRPYVVEAFRIPSQSMESTLLIGDQLLVLKVVQGQYIPWTDRANPMLNPFRGDSLGLLMPGTESLARGEILVFRYPVNTRRDFIKRVVALSGDTILVRNDTLFVNGRPSDFPTAFQDRVSPSILDSNWPGCLPSLRGRVADLRFDTIAEGCILLPSGEIAYVVPPQCIFMMGDNRDHSSDSRVWGPLDTDLIKGRALAIYWSWSTDDGLPRIGRMARVIR